MLKKTAFFICIALLGHPFAQTANAGQGSPQLVPWTEAEKIFPRYATFTVVDIETGKRFKVQRRAGSRHADVQPLTEADTAVMKEIYNGQWSWKRRAIYAVKGKWKIAASMNGMPHGAGALENNFRGHFCIHFYKSTTHSRKIMDLSHKLMIFKAGGRLGELAGSQNPYETVKYFLSGMKEQDAKIVSLLSASRINWTPVLASIENVKIVRLPTEQRGDISTELALKIPVEVEWHIRDEAKRITTSEIKLFRASPLDGWRIDADGFIKENRLGLDELKK